jgi:hypothetical protein
MFDSNARKSSRPLPKIIEKPVEVSMHAAADSRRLVAPKWLLDGSESMRSPASIDGLPTDTSPEPYLIAKNEGKFLQSKSLNATLVSHLKVVEINRKLKDLAKLLKYAEEEPFWMTPSMISSRSSTPLS